MANAMEIDSASTTPSRAITLESDTPTTATDPNDPDPIVASYDIYANPSLPENRKLLVLQHTNKQHSNGRLAYKGIGEVRLKTKAGFLELDVPIPHGHGDYDRDKGLRWGSALARSVAAKNGGTHGLAGGFGVGVPTRPGGGGGAGRGAGKRPDDLEHELSMLDWSEAVRQDKVLRTQTLGGQFGTGKETNFRWVVGVFKDDKLHLTPATSIIPLRPQLHHIDAWAEQDRLSRPREGAAAAGPGPGAGATGKEGGAAAGPSQGGAAAKAIHMSIKSAGTEGGEVSVDTMIERLRKVQVEPWTKLKYEDDETDRAWHMFNDHLVSPQPGPKDKGKGKEKQGEKAAGEDKSPEQKYKAQWNENEFLQAVSGLKDNQQGDTKPQDDEVEVKAEVVNPTPVRAAAAKGKGKAVAGPAAAPATRKGAGGRGKSVAFKE
ncbi:hypothetical protein F5Y04DRAFT_165898 [Hypomontagnella monticulosa]|nr:hypothetical protein F5Y04DRAFT_165898 [Hypomontagnella monticulosa]